jgi:hypothetical protein
MASTAEKVDIKPKKMVPKHYFVLCWKINKVKNQQLVAQILFRQNLPFDPKGILSVRWCFISDPSKSPSALECGRPCTEQGTPLLIRPSPWGSGRDAFASRSRRDSLREHLLDQIQLWMGLGNKPSSGFPIIRTWNNWINDFYLGREGLIFSPFWL